MGLPYVPYIMPLHAFRVGSLLSTIWLKLYKVKGRQKNISSKTFISIMLDRRTPAVSAEATAGLRSMAGRTHDTVVCAPEPSEQSGGSKRARGRGSPIMRWCSDVSRGDGTGTCGLPHVVLAVSMYSIIIIYNSRNVTACLVHPTDPTQWSPECH